MLRLLTILITLIPLLALAQIETLPEIPDNGPGGAPQQGDGDRLEGDLSNQNSNNGNVTKTYNGAGSNSMPVSTAVAPSLMVTGNDSCLKSVSNGIQLVGVGVSSGKYVQDDLCNLRKFAITLSQLGLKVSAISLLCSEPSIYRALLVSGSPCPVLKYGRLVVGKSAYLEIKSNPSLYIPDYKDEAEFYDAILGVGVETSEGEDPSGSMSDRFRTSNSQRDQ